MFYDEYCKLCNAVGKSPSACAEEMGYQRSVITRWKSGAEPRYATLLKIADYFGVDVAVLKGETLVLSDIQNSLISAVRSLSDEDAAVLLVLAKQLLKQGKARGDE